MTTTAKSFALVALVATMSVGAFTLGIASASAQSPLPAAYKNYCITRTICNNGFQWKCNRCDSRYSWRRGCRPTFKAC